jgi:hypothetical protein
VSAARRRHERATAGKLAAPSSSSRAMALMSPGATRSPTRTRDGAQGDLAAAGKDLAIIKAKRCVVDGRMNPLLLQDVGNTLRAKGDKRGAVAALQLALAACDGEWCRPAIAKDLEAAKR